MIGLTIPVVALSDQGEETSDRTLGRPCIKTGLSWTSVLDPIPNHPSINWTFGKIDTGADLVVIDRTFANLKEPMPAPVTTLPASTAAGPCLMPICRGILYVTNGFRCIAIEIDVAVGEVGSAYRMLLGRDLLRYTTFTYNRAYGIEKLSIDPPPPGILNGVDARPQMKL
ncbi:hypothetical protein [Bradyrhizobium sp. USDA 329]|uniref:hypothetical protein n=1 Tax=unclassified Bradyrhizobium TaxID=2631580 RepID=UPI0035190C9E